MKRNVIILPFTLNRHKQNPEVEKASASATMSSGKSVLFSTCTHWCSFLLLVIFLFVSDAIIHICYLNFGPKSS